LQKSGLLIIILVLGVLLSLLAGHHADRETGDPVNNFLNSHTLMQMATDASFFAVMAVGATMVIISGGIDLSVGSVYALSGVLTALLLRSLGPTSPVAVVFLGIALCLGLGLLCGLLNGVMIVGLRVHPFIITLGTMWAFRGIAFVTSKAESILVVDEPTRGVDVGAKAEIHGLLDALAQQGAGILLISSELPELLSLSSRILVLREGCLVGELARQDPGRPHVPNGRSRIESSRTRHPVFPAPAVSRPGRPGYGRRWMATWRHRSRLAWFPAPSAPWASGHRQDSEPAGKHPPGAARCSRSPAQA